MSTNERALKPGNFFSFGLIKISSIILFSFFAFNLNAQSVAKIPTVINAIPNSLNGKLEVDFDNDKQVDNLLVIVTDSLGNTIFLENLYRFKGSYKKSIELTNKGKGSFTLHISKDEEKINKKLVFK